MNKTYFRIRCIIAWVTGILCFLAFFSAFYPVKIFDLQLTALLQRFLVDVSLTAAILLSALLLLTLFFGRVYCSTLCPFGLLQEFLMLVFPTPHRLSSKPSGQIFSCCRFLRHAARRHGCRHSPD